MNSRRGFLILVTVVLTVMLAFLALPTQAQCFPRTDWQSYTVVRGDTLQRIALRYGISTAELANANCLTNWNLIYRGQQLYVPPGGSVPVPTLPAMPPANGVTGSFQQYENGLMIWRSDSSDIWVLDNSGRATRYRALIYGLLPEAFNVGPTPTNRIRPVLGFGRVWGNLIDVRSRLGWATQAEMGATITPQGSGIDLVTLAAGRGQLVIVSALGSWNYVTGTPPTPAPTLPPTAAPQPPAALTGSYQPFENGLMIWRSDTGAIWVLYNGGAAVHYPVTSYSTLPVNPFITPIPAGRVHPILGFGRIWSNFPAVRQQLGWATEPEQGMTFAPQPDGTNIITLGANRARLLIYSQSSNWVYASGSPQLPAPQPTLPPTAPPVTPQILAFNANPNTVTPGQSVTLNWEVQGVQGVLIEVNNAATTPEPEVILSNLGLSGVTTFTVPADYRGVGFTIYGLNFGTDGSVQKVIGSTVFVAVNAPTTSTTVYAAYQPYDGGFMIWRSDSGDIFVFYNFGAVSTYPVSYYGSFPENPVTLPTPPGKVRPISGFGRVWGSQPYFQAQLGWAVAPEQGYTMTIENLSDGRTRFTLPNGYGVSFGNGSWTP